MIKKRLAEGVLEMIVRGTLPDEEDPKLELVVGMSSLLYLTGVVSLDTVDGALRSGCRTSSTDLEIIESNNDRRLCLRYLFHSVPSNLGALPKIERGM
jgi:hypothetical protein